MLLISRPDISSEELQDFGRERFIELPVDKYLALLGLEPNSSQIAIVNALNNPAYRFVVAAISRRQGKTFIANIIGQLKALVPNTNVLIMSPNFNLSQISFEEQRRLLRKFDIEITKDNQKDRVVELQNGSTIRMGSVNQADSVVGRSYDFIIFDEAALSTDGESAFNVQLRPTLDKPKSKTLFISTPRGKMNWFSQFYDRGLTEEFKYRQWASIQADYHENPRISVQDIEEAKGSMTDAEFAQEYMASFNIFLGQIYRFDREKCVQDLSEMDWTNMDTIAGLDVGFKDATSFIIVKYDYTTNKYYVVHEYEDNERTTSHHADAIKTMEQDWNIDIIYCDHSAAQTRNDFAYDHDIVTAAAKKSVNDGIAFLQNIIEKDNLIVDQRCVKTLAMLDQYRWDPNEKLLTERPIHDKYSHMADALRYAIYSYIVSTGQL